MVEGYIRILYEHIFIDLIAERIDFMGKASTIIKCKNHFKDGGSKPSKNDFISKWIKMINISEKNISIG